MCIGLRSDLPVVNPIDTHRNRPWLFLLMALALAVPLCGCGGGTNTIASNSTPPAPTLTLSSSLSSATAGQPLTLTWVSSEPATCTASGAWSGVQLVSGSAVVVPNSVGNLTYSLSCNGTAGTATASAQVVVAAPVFPVMNSFTPNATTISTSEGAPYGDCEFWTKTAGQCSIDSNFGYGPTRVMRIYICLTGEVSESQCSQQPPITGPISAQMLSDIDSRLSAFAGTGRRIMPRFTYNFGPSGPTAQDAPLSVILNHIDQVAPIILKYKDLVFGLEAGFIGTWGEWHDSTNGNDTAAAQAAVLNKELSYFSGVFPILERYPGDLIQYTGGFTPPSGIGLHDDSYASTSTDGGTWTTCPNTEGYCLSGVTASQLENYAAAVSTATMFVGEFAEAYSTLQTCSALDAYSYLYHVQSIILTPPADVTAELQNEGCALNFYNKVGTRIEVQQVTVSGTPSASGQFTVGMKLVNTGYGRVIRQRHATLLLLSGGTVVAQYPLALSTMDLTQLASAATPVAQTFQASVTLPASLTAGQVYTLALSVPDPATSLSSQAAYALPLNSMDAYGQAIFNSATGYNQLALFQAR